MDVTWVVVAVHTEDKPVVHTEIVVASNTG